MSKICSLSPDVNLSLERGRESVCHLVSLLPHSRSRRPTISPYGARSRKGPGQKRQALFRQRVLGLGERPPDSGGAGDGLVVGGERLDDHGTVVTDLV